MSKTATKRAVPVFLTLFFVLLVVRALFPDFFAGLGEGFTDGLR